MLSFQPPTDATPHLQLVRIEQNGQHTHRQAQQCLTQLPIRPHLIQVAQQGQQHVRNCRNRIQTLSSHMPQQRQQAAGVMLHCAELVNKGSGKP
jgi:hypothetical protein